MNRLTDGFVSILIVLANCGAVAAQQPPANPREGLPTANIPAAEPAKADQKKTPRAAASIDLSGHWVPLITEDWRWRMMTPPKGDYASVPLNAEGKRVADTWDAAREAGSCKHFGAPGLLRNPLRVNFSWTDDKTLRLETDHGMQTRLFNFDAAPKSDAAPTLQGSSSAQWDRKSLKVVTTRLLPGYLRKNGVPYSENAVLTEYFDRYTGFGEDWMTVTTIVNDPKYLSTEFVTTTHFKRLKDEKEWNPTPCAAS